MVDPIGIAPSRSPSPSPLPFPTSTPRAEPTFNGGPSLFDEYRNDATQLVNGALDDALLPSADAIDRLVGSAQYEVNLRSSAADLLDARARELVANGAPALHVDGAYHNLRLEQLDLSAAESRLADLSETSLRRKAFDVAGDLVGGLIALDDLVQGDREVKKLAETDPRAAWRKSLSTLFGAVVDGASPVSKLSKGGLKAAIGDVGLGALVKRAAERVADATFDPINRLAHKLAEQPWWPKVRRPRVGLSD